MTRCNWCGVSGAGDATRLSDGRRTQHRSERRRAFQTSRATQSDRWGRHHQSCDSPATYLPTQNVCLWRSLHAWRPSRTCFSALHCLVAFNYLRFEPSWHIFRSWL